MSEDQIIEEAGPYQTDRDYRRQGRNIVVAMLASVVPRNVMVDPRILAGGDAHYTFGKVQKALQRAPQARRRQLPMHFYTEFVGTDYATMVGCPLTNRSWYLQHLVELGALRIAYNDAILCVLQENYHYESMEKNLWRHLAHQVITPLMRTFHMDRRHSVVYLENIVERDVVSSPGFPYKIEEATHLGEADLGIQIQQYEKR